jgi:hypothetical protein
MAMMHEKSRAKTTRPRLISPAFCSEIRFDVMSAVMPRGVLKRHCHLGGVREYCY